MSKRKLHPDWPEWDDTKKSWENGGPAVELASGFDDYPTFQTASPVSQKTDAFSMHDIDHITDYHLESGGTVWEPTHGDNIGSELNFVLVGQLKDGRWFSGTLWNDYTGWGCQSGADFRVADTLGEIHQYGLDESERNRFAITLTDNQRKGINA